MLWRHGKLKTGILGAARLARLLLCFVPWLGATSHAAVRMPVRISPPKLYIHCLRDNREIAFLLRWDYEFAYSSTDVGGFRIYRRVEEGDYSLLASLNRSGAEANTTVVRESPNKYVYRYRDNGVQPGKAYSYKVVAFDAAGNQAFNEARIRTDPRPAVGGVAGPDNVLVVINRSSPESVEIGEYYQRRRDIPKQNLLYLPYRGNSEIVRLQYFEKNIKLPIREYLVSQGLKERILYIVMTYGLPYRISVRGGKGRGFC